MKTQLFLLFICAASLFEMQAQIVDNAMWTEYNINIQSDAIVSKRQYWTTSDTVIDGKIYKKVIDKDRYLGAIREENGKVYAHLEYGDYMGKGEFLLYDFTLQVGETIKSTASEGALSYPDGITVMQIDEITLENGEVRKKFIFYETEPWIEGIGSMMGLFHDAMWHATNYHVSYLVCFQNNNVPIFINNIHCLDGKCCKNDDMGISQISKDKEIVIYPNPTNETFFLSLPSLNSKHIVIRILDGLGRELYKQSHIRSEFIEVNISDYSSGLYYVIAQDDESFLYSNKIIKR